MITHVAVVADAEINTRVIVGANTLIGIKIAMADTVEKRMGLQTLINHDLTLILNIFFAQ